MDKVEKDALLSLATSMGYAGFGRKQYYFNDGYVTGASRELLNRLSFPDKLRDRKELLNVFIDFKKLRGEVIGVLQGMKYRPPEIDMDYGDLEPTKKNEDVLLDAARNDILFFKTVKKDGDGNNARSMGFSLIAYNKKTNHIIDNNKISIDSLLYLAGKSREDIASDSSIPIIWPVFNPYITDLVFQTVELQFSEDKIYALNTAIPAKWMTSASPEVKPRFTGFIKRLVEHLFPEPDDRERVLDWCHYAIFKRNGTVLCLAGARGTGKSTFVEILGHLVGVNYMEIVNEAILKDKFNSQFYNKRLIVFEEVALQESSAINRVKAWCNTQLTIEAKGQDAFKADNFTSMVFLLNRLDELKIQPQERRFSIPVVADANLLTIMSEREIDDFKVGLESGDQSVLDQLAEFGLFLKARKPKYSEHLPIRGENFDRVSDLSMTEWQSHLKEFVKNNGEDGEVIPISAIFSPPRQSDKEPIKYPQKRATIENFLMDYRHLGRYRIGRVVELNEFALTKAEDKYGVTRKRPGSARRMYGVLPDKEFLKAFGTKKISGEDLL